MIWLMLYWLLGFVVAKLNNHLVDNYGVDEPRVDTYGEAISFMWFWPMVVVAYMVDHAPAGIKNFFERKF